MQSTSPPPFLWLFWLQGGKTVTEWNKFLWSTRKEVDGLAMVASFAGFAFREVLFCIQVKKEGKWGEFKNELVSPCCSSCVLCDSWVLWKFYVFLKNTCYWLDCLDSEELELFLPSVSLPLLKGRRNVANSGLVMASTSGHWLVRCCLG